MTLSLRRVFRNALAGGSLGRSVTTAILATVLTGISTPVFAACADSNANPPAIMIDVRAAMLTGDYDRFVAAADAANRIEAPQKLNIVNVLKNAHPDGFDFCEVLLRRDLSDKMFQELSVFSEAGKNWIFLYALGARIEGKETLLNFKFSASAAEELSKFR